MFFTVFPFCLSLYIHIYIYIMGSWNTATKYDYSKSKILTKISAHFSKR